MLFNNKVVWITGASSGIGAELALQFATLQARLILTARNIAALLQVQQQCLQFTKNCTILAADLLQNESIENLTHKALQQYGTIDIVFLNAGVTQRSLAAETNLIVYRQLMEINYFAPITITKYLLPIFEQQKTGHIVAISSVAGLIGFPLRTGYAAAKHALKGFFETLQTEHTVLGLHITIVSPGRINTPISLSALTKDGTAHNVKDAGQLNGITVAHCAKKIIKAIGKKQKHIIIARSEKLLYWLRWYFPFLYYKIARQKGLKQ